MKKNEPKYNRGSIVFIPDYLSKQLSKLGVTSEKLFIISTMLDDSDRYGTINKMGGLLRDNVSSRDIRDIAILNNALYKYLYKIDIRHFPLSALSVLLDICDAAIGEYVSDQNAVTEVVNLYINQKIDIKSILVNGNNKNELYTCDVMTDTLLVIVHDGFTNFIVNNDKEVTDNLSVGLLDYYTQRLGTTSFEKSFLLTLWLDASNAKIKT